VRIHDELTGTGTLRWRDPPDACPTLVRRWGSTTDDTRAAAEAPRRESTAALAGVAPEIAHSLVRFAERLAGDDSRGAPRADPGSGASYPKDQPDRWRR